MSTIYLIFIKQIGKLQLLGLGINVNSLIYTQAQRIKFQPSLQKNKSHYRIHGKGARKCYERMVKNFIMGHAQNGSLVSWP